MESDNRLPSGQWNGFFIESHHPRRGWMHLYLSFADGETKGEGTDYIGPWVSLGDYDTSSGRCTWLKRYIGKHDVFYAGNCSENGILGQWEIGGRNSHFGRIS